MMLSTYLAHLAVPAQVLGGTSAVPYLILLLALILLFALIIWLYQRKSEKPVEAAQSSGNSTSAYPGTVADEGVATVVAEPGVAAVVDTDANLEPPADIPAADIADDTESTQLELPIDDATTVSDPVEEQATVDEDKSEDAKEDTPAE